MRERGLKQKCAGTGIADKVSLPMRERGLKPEIRCKNSKKIYVAPHAGAWIETPPLFCELSLLLSLPMRERGLKQLNAAGDKNYLGRSPCGSVD